MLIKTGGRGSRRARAFRRAAGMAGMGDVDALIVGPDLALGRRELWRRGMAGMGATPGELSRGWDALRPRGGSSLADTLTGGKVTEISGQLASAKLGLQIAVGASLFAAVAALVALKRK